MRRAGTWTGDNATAGNRHTGGVWSSARLNAPRRSCAADRRFGTKLRHPTTTSGTTRGKSAVVSVRSIAPAINRPRKSAKLCRIRVHHVLEGPEAAQESARPARRPDRQTDRPRAHSIQRFRLKLSQSSRRSRTARTAADSGAQEPDLARSVWRALTRRPSGRKHPQCPRDRST